MLEELKTLAKETLDSIFQEFIETEINAIMAEDFIIRIANDTRFKCLKFEDTGN